MAKIRPERSVAIVQRAGALPCLRAAAVSAGFPDPGRTVESGEELHALLSRRDPHWPDAPAPNLILVDLDLLPGPEALGRIKEDELLCAVPIVVFVATGETRAVHRAYDLGVNSVIVKEGSGDAWPERMAVIFRYWFESVELPVAR